MSQGVIRLRSLARLEAVKATVRHPAGKLGDKATMFGRGLETRNLALFAYHDGKGHTGCAIPCVVHCRDPLCNGMTSKNVFQRISASGQEPLGFGFGPGDVKAAPKP